MEKIKFTIDGKEISCEKGKTILAAALENNIEIPNLCYAKELLPYGACGVCSVEIKGKEKLVRSCAVEVEDNMEILTNSKLALKARKATLELLLSDHEGDCKAPCSLNCPANTDIMGYLKQIALGNDKEAVRIIKEKIPIPASIGRICPHPCENSCRRTLVEQSLSIAYLKAFVADRDLVSQDPFMPEIAKEKGKSVGIIGGGPGGLGAAYKLKTMGYSVTVYDAMPEMGGMLRYGIPKYRLPKTVLKSEVSLIKKLGVTFKNGISIGKDVEFDEIKNKHDAVLIAIGAWNGGKIGCQGEDLLGVISGIDFLRSVNMDNAPAIGEKVAVVGGGNTAMDACRSAIRCGAKEVYVIYRRTREEAPAEDSEIAEAIEEGVKFKFLTSPTEIIGENGKVKAIKLQIMKLGEKDPTGRRAPVPIEGNFEIFDVDTVISAIGQKCNATGFEKIALTNRKTIETDNCCRTNIKGVFAAGDATNEGASIAIKAIAEGNTAALAIDAYLCGKDFSAEKPYYSKRNPSPKDYIKIEKIPRIKMPVTSAAERVKSFDEVIKGFTEEKARAEARRCLECGCSAFESCKLIRYANMANIEENRFWGEKHPSFKENLLGTIEHDQGKCILCNLCVRTCTETVGKGVLGLVDRGFATVIKPKPKKSDLDYCKGCNRCAQICPTGALKIIK